MSRRKYKRKSWPLLGIGNDLLGQKKQWEFLKLTNGISSKLKTCFTKATEKAHKRQQIVQCNFLG